jgi:hypothetical protein
MSGKTGRQGDPSALKELMQAWGMGAAQESCRSGHGTEWQIKKLVMHACETIGEI